MDEVERMADMVTEYLPWKLPRSTRLFEPCDAWSIRGVFDRESGSTPDVKHLSHRQVPCGDETAACLGIGPPKPTLELNIHRIGPFSRPGCSRRATADQSDVLSAVSRPPVRMLSIGPCLLYTSPSPRD